MTTTSNLAKPKKIKRLKGLLGLLDIKQYDIARDAGISRWHFNHIVNGDVVPSQQLQERIKHQLALRGATQEMMRGLFRVDKKR